MDEIIECTKNGVKGWKHREDGICHIGLEAKQRAIRDEKTMKAENFKKVPREIKKKSLKAKKNG